MTIILVAILMYIVVSFTLISCPLGIAFDAQGFEFLNPIVIYNNIKVNIFGTILITILLNIILAPYAICYWVYKVCTVGRKK